MSDLRYLVKSRDRWTCKYCSRRFTELTVDQFDSNKYITFCKTCKEYLDSLPYEQRVSICSALIRESKIVLVGDCHNRFNALDYVLSNEEPFDFFLSVGDISSSEDMTDYGWSIVRKYYDRGYAVRGNHDDTDIFKPVELHQEVNGVKVAGLSGMFSSKNFVKETPSNISFREFLYISHLKNIDILITHQPPPGLFKGVGVPIFNDLLSYVAPKIYVSGHIHKYKTKFYLSTFCMSLPLINSGYAVAYFQGNDLRDIEVTLKKNKRTVKI